MFLSSDNLQKRGVEFQPGDLFFEDKDRRIRFEDIEAFYVASTDHYTNSAYQGHEYTLTLSLKGESAPYKLEACTNRKASYKTIKALHDAINTYMEDRITRDVEAGEEVPFPVQSGKYLVLAGPDGIRVRPLKGNGGDFRVKQIFKSRDNKLLELIGTGGRAKLLIQHLSNARIFISLALGQVPFQVKPESKLQKRLILGAYGVGALAGLNSWFKVVDGGEVFNGICTFAGILLGVTIFITPFMMVVEKMNRRKKRREVQELEPPAGPQT